MTPQREPAGSAALCARGQQAFALGMWEEAMRLAAGALAIDPLNAIAFSLLTSARERLDLMASAGGERRLLTLLMCDVVDSSGLTRRLGPDTYKECLLQLHRLTVDAVTRYEGRVAQYRGDGVMAYFSYPQAHEDDAARGVLAGLAISRGMVRIADDLAERDIDFAVRVGIATGSVVLAPMGAGQWTTSDMVIGDSANLAARIQELAERNGVVISDATKQLVDEQFRLRTQPVDGLKSFPERVLVHHVVGEKPAALLVERHTVPFVGRAAEMGVLGDAWNAVTAGEQRVVVLTGEGGVGKSRLAAQLVNLVNATGGRSLELRCLATGEHSPLHPVAVALRRLLAFDHDTPLTFDAVRERLLVVGGGTLPADDADWVVARLFGIDVPVDLLPERIRERTLAVLAELVGDAARRAPFLVLVDDLQHADETTLALVRQVIAAVPTGLAVVATCRTEAAALPGALRLPVPALDHAECVELVRAIVVDDIGDIDVDVDDIATRSGGIPFFAEELARWRLEGSATSPLPTALDAVLTARLDRLDPRARDAASTMAVLGLVADRALLQEITAVEGDRIDQLLGALVGAGVVEPTRDAAADRFRFRHALTRDAAYNRLTTEARLARHGRCADVLGAHAAAGEPVAPEDVAGHLGAAGRDAESVPWWMAAGSRAAASGAHAEAIVQFGRGLDRVDLLAPSTDRSVLALGLQLGAAQSALMIHGYTADDVLDGYERATELCAELAGLDDRPELLSALWGLQTHHLVRGDLDRSAELAHRALDVAVNVGEPSLIATAEAVVGYVEFFRGHLVAARDHLLAGIAGDDLRVMPHDPRLVSHALLAICTLLLGDDETAATHAAAAHAGLDELTDQRLAFTQSFVDCYLTNYHDFRGDPAEAASCALAAWTTSSAHGFTQWVGASGLLTAALMCGGDGAAQGVALLSWGIEEWRKAGAELMTPYFLGVLAGAQLRQGQQEAAERAYDESLTLAAQTSEQFFTAELLRGRAAARVARGDAAAARQDLLDAAALADAQGAVTFRRRAEADLDALDLATAAGPG